MKKILPNLILGLILLSGCGGLTLQEAEEARFYATQYAMDPIHNIPPAKYQTMVATAFGYTFNIAQPTATPNPNWTPTLSAMEWSATQAALVQNNALTAQAQQQAFEMDKLRAEQAAKNSENTAVAARSTAEAYSLQQTAEARVAAEATNVASTQIAAVATNDYIHRVNDQNTAVAAASTNAVLPTHAIWTQNAVYVIQTVEQGNAERVALAVEGQRATNLWKAFLPIAGFIVGLYVLSKALFKWLRQRVHQRDEFGRPPLLTIEDDAGNTNIIKSEILPKAITSISATGAVRAYELTSNEEQADINRRNQAVDALAVLPTPYAQQGTKIMNAEFGRGGPPRVNVGQPGNGNMQNVLDELDSKLIEEE